jgi:hypothetical protein
MGVAHMVTLPGAAISAAMATQPLYDISVTTPRPAFILAKKADSVCGSIRDVTETSLKFFRAFRIAWSQYRRAVAADATIPRPAQNGTAPRTGTEEDQP